MSCGVRPTGPTPAGPPWVLARPQNGRPRSRSPSFGEAATTLALLAPVAGAVVMVRLRTRRRRRYARWEVAIYRADRAGLDAIEAMFAALHKRLLRRWWQRVLHGQPGIALEIHLLAPATGGEGVRGRLCDQCAGRRRGGNRDGASGGVSELPAAALRRRARPGRALAPEEARRVHQADGAGRPAHVRALAAGRPAARGDGRDRRARVRAARDHPRAGGPRARGAARLQATRG